MLKIDASYATFRANCLVRLLRLTRASRSVWPEWARHNLFKASAFPLGLIVPIKYRLDVNVCTKATH